MRWCIVGPGVSSFNGKSHVFSQKKQVEIAGEGKGLWVAGDRARPLESKAAFGGLEWGGATAVPTPSSALRLCQGKWKIVAQASGSGRSRGQFWNPREEG